MNQPSPPASRGKNFARALRHRNFRMLWIGTLVSNSGDWLDQVALNWLILDQTGSAFYLGLVNLFRALPILCFTLLAGALADRVNRLHLLFAIQFVAMILATTIAVLTFLGEPPIWALLALAFGRGTVTAFNLPARQSLIPKLVPREDLPNAIAMNAVTLNMTKVIGPMLSGLIIATAGVAACFAVNAASYLAVLYTLFRMTLPPLKQQAARPTESLGAAVISGLKYVANDRTLSLLMLLALIPIFLGQPFIHLLVLFAHDALDWGPVGLGAITAAAGLGSVLGALALGGFDSMLHRGAALLAMIAGLGLSLIALAVNPVDALAPIILLVAGAFFICFNTILNTILQLMVPDEYRGRVMSTMFVNRALVPLGTAVAAWFAAFTDIRLTYAAMGLGLLLCAGWFALLSPRIRKLHVDG